MVKIDVTDTRAKQPLIAGMLVCAMAVGSSLAPDPLAPPGRPAKQEQRVIGQKKGREHMDELDAESWEPPIHLRTSLSLSRRDLVARAHTI